MSGTPTRVLLIEDTQDDADIVQEALDGAKDVVFQVERATRLSDGVAHLQKGGYQLVLTDLHLPDSKGLETVVTVSRQAKRIPVVVLTSEGDSALAVEAVKRGAQDYLVKAHIQVYPDLLLRAMRYSIERKRVEERERELTDAVTRTALSEQQRATKLNEAYEELKRTQAMLAQSEKMAAVGQLASGIAHEVKNPLNIILQSVNYLEPELRPRGGEQAEVLQVMRDAVMSADKIIHGLLDFSKPAPLTIEPTAIDEVITASLALVKAKLKEPKISLITELAPDLPPVMVDANQMKQVFINLFFNAIAAMPNGGQLTVRAARRTLTTPGQGVGSRVSDLFRVGDQVVACDVADTGVGISEDDLPRVFNPFFTTKAPGEGVGLGLAITAAIMLAHRGTIQLGSEVGKGSTAVLLLPITTHQQPGRSDGAAAETGGSHA